MESITLSVPDETRKLMKEFPDVNWSGFVRKAIEERARELKRIEGLKRELAKEREFDTWAISVVRDGRKGRAQQLRKVA